MIADRTSGIFQGKAYVEFETRKDAEGALAHFDGVLIRWLAWLPVTSVARVKLTDKW